MERFWRSLWPGPTPETFVFYPGAHFMVTARQARTRPRDFYESALEVSASHPDGLRIVSNDVGTTFLTPMGFLPNFVIENCRFIFAPFAGCKPRGKMFPVMSGHGKRRNKVFIREFTFARMIA